MTYFVGHPNGAIQEATTTTDAVLVPITGPEIDKLLEERSYYQGAEIPGGLYKGNDQATQSIGGKAVLSTTSKVDAEVVYQLVKSVFENIERFQRLHPAFKDLKPEEMIEVGLSAPLHEGAERYYKERGWLGWTGRVVRRPDCHAQLRTRAPYGHGFSRFRYLKNRPHFMQDKQLSTEELIAQDVGARSPAGPMAAVIAGHCSGRCSSCGSPRRCRSSSASAC